MAKIKIGDRYGKRTIIAWDKEKHRWVARCDCGKVDVVESSIALGRLQMCKLCSEEKFKKLTTKNGLSHSPIYETWRSIKRRCYQKNFISYKWYGGRGITVCEEWRNSFVKFCDWAMANGYQQGLTIDRINKDGNYCPENCRWVDNLTQQNNRTDNKNLTFNGTTKTMSEWARFFGIKYITLKTRIRNGWDIEKALTTPVKQYKR